MNVDLENKKCLCCDMTFKLKTDLNRHIMTKKHINKCLGVDKTKCPFCDYSTKDKSDLNKHMKRKHEYIIKEKINKANKAIINDKKSELPINAIKAYTLLITEENVLKFALFGLKSRYKRNINRNYKPTEDIMKEIKLNYNQKLEDYNNCIKKKEKLIELYPKLKSYKPEINSIEDKEEEEEYESD
jgi:uncharacterized C2H2 Zn-finger protein